MILRVLFPFAGETLGGSHVSTLSLARALRDQGADCTFALAARGRFFDLLEQHGFEPLQLPYCSFYGLGHGLSFQIRRSLSAMRLRRWILKQNPRIVHTNDLTMNLMWSLACAHTPIRHIWHQRTVAPTGRKYNDTFAPGIAKASGAVFVSHFAEASVEKAIQPVRRVIYNPIIAPPVPSRAYPTNRPVRVGVLSNYHGRKRLEVFLEAAARLSSEDMQFFIAGSIRTEQKSALLGIAASSGLSEKLTISEPTLDPFSWLVEVDILVCPARYEAFGRTLVEGMISGCVVVASAEGGHLEIVNHGKNGFLFEPDDIDDLVAKIKMAAVARDSGWPTSRIEEDARTRYAADAHALEIMSLYREVLR